jgi:phosphopantothenoylcysteine decarboxylase/phosphopantothenate--cysteine ligase
MIAKTLLITCGPSYEPIDEVRRITNFSTGELGVTLAEFAAAMGWEVVCFKGRLATWPDPRPPVKTILFETNGSLLNLMMPYQNLEVRAIFHAAALCDYRVAGITGGFAEGAGKIESRAGALTLRLEPAAKVLPQLRPLFPRACIVGWKYELDGARGDVVAKGRAQLDTCGTDVCVLNGRAFGKGFGLLTVDGSLTLASDKPSLAKLLLDRMAAPP